jgi:hypothetical protein
MEALLVELRQTAPLTRFRDESGTLQSSAQERTAKAPSEELQVHLTVLSCHNFAFQPIAFISTKTLLSPTKLLSPTTLEYSHWRWRLHDAIFSRFCRRQSHAPVRRLCCYSANEHQNKPHNTVAVALTPHPRAAKRWRLSPATILMSRFAQLAFTPPDHHKIFCEFDQSYATGCYGLHQRYRNTCELLQPLS